MHVSVCVYIIHTVYLLHVSATDVAIFKEVHYKGLIHQNITEVSEPMHRYECITKLSVAHNSLVCDCKLHYTFECYTGGDASYKAQI